MCFSLTAQTLFGCFLWIPACCFIWKYSIIRSETVNMVHETWGSKLDYLLTVIGYSIGSSALWKFPYMCMRNGGGAYLIPFVLFTVIGAIPLVFLEMVIGQYSQSGPIKVWRLCPLFKGVGVGSVLITWLLAIYFPPMFGWFIYYLYHSFFSEIPWASCKNSWNSESCISYEHLNITPTTATYNFTKTARSINSSLAFGNLSHLHNFTGGDTSMTAEEEFWRYNVLQLTDGLENLGGMRWSLVGTLAITHLAVFLCMFQGIRISGKVVYVTVTVPVILVTIFLIQGCMLPGAAEGIYYYIYPDFEKLKDPKIWIEACNFALYSMGIAMGCIVTMAGHNRVDNNCFRDAVVVCLIDAGTTIYCGFAVFALTGNVAYRRNVPITTFQSSGYNLGFIVLPEATASLPLPQLWSALTFIMLLTLGIDSLVPCYEMVVTSFADQFPVLAERRWVLNVMVLVPSFLLGLPYVTQGGIYLFTLVDWYAFFPSMALFAVLECVVVTWIYGTRRMKKDVFDMWGMHIPFITNVMLTYVLPVLLLVVFVYACYSYRPPKYNDYNYPQWATVLGWLISMASILPIPVVGVWTVWKMPGTSFKVKLRQSLQSDPRWRSLKDDSRNSDNQQDLTESLV